MSGAKDLEIGEHFDAGVAAGNAAKALARYYSHEKKQDHDHLYGGRFFEAIARSDPRHGCNSVGPEANIFTASEILAVTALSVEVPPTGVNQLLYDEYYSKQLAQIPIKTNIWDEAAESLLEKDGPIYKTWDRLKEIDGIGPVTAGKLLAVKRPHLVPIWDKEVQKVLEPPKDFFWLSMCLTLKDEDLRDSVEDVRESAITIANDSKDTPAADAIESLSLLRVVDVVIWMKGKKNPPYDTDG